MPARHARNRHARRRASDAAHRGATVARERAARTVEPPLLGLLVGEPDGGRLGLVVDRIHHAVLAIRAEIPLAVLRDTIAQFPTCSESYVIALRTLPGKASGAL